MTSIFAIYQRQKTGGNPILSHCVYRKPDLPVNSRLEAKEYKLHGALPEQWEARLEAANLGELREKFAAMDKAPTNAGVQIYAVRHCRPNIDDNKDAPDPLFFYADRNAAVGYTEDVLRREKKSLLMQAITLYPDQDICRKMQAAMLFEKRLRKTYGLEPR